MQSICQGEVLDDNIAGSQDDFQVPDIGQIVAMVAGDSKPRDPKIILAKVLSYKHRLQLTQTNFSTLVDLLAS